MSLNVRSTSKIIGFSNNVKGRLNAQIFTTLRPHDPTRKIEDTLNVYVNHKFFCKVRILAIRTVKINQITEFEARLNSGVSRVNFIKSVKKFYKTQGFLYDLQFFNLILLEKIDSQLEL